MIARTFKKLLPGLGELNRWQKIIFYLNVLVLFTMLITWLSYWIPPTATTFFSFLGLGFPFLLIITILFIPFWLIMNKRHYLYTLSVLLICSPMIFSTITFNPFKDKADVTSPHLKVLSYNVRLFDLYNWTENIASKDKMFDFISKQNPDIACFQEYYRSEQDFYKEKFKTTDSLIHLLRANQVHEHYTHEIDGPQFFGLATFVAYPIVHKGVIEFGNDKNNACIYTDFLFDGDTIRVYNAHLASIRFRNEDYNFINKMGNVKKYKTGEGEQKIIERLSDAYVKRTSQVELILKNMKRCPYPIIFCGDFNDTPISYTYNQFSNYLHDSFLEAGNGYGGTYVGTPSFRIDYIWHDKVFNAFDFNVHDVIFSDHYPVTTYLEYLKD